MIASYLGFKPTADPVITSGSAVPRPRMTPPTGAMLNLFNSLGGKPGTKTVVL